MPRLKQLAGRMPRDTDSDSTPDMWKSRARPTSSSFSDEEEIVRPSPSTFQVVPMGQTISSGQAGPSTKTSSKPSLPKIFGLLNAIMGLLVGAKVDGTFVGLFRIFTEEFAGRLPELFQFLMDAYGFLIEANVDEGMLTLFEDWSSQILDDEGVQDAVMFDDESENTVSEEMRGIGKGKQNDGSESEEEEVASDRTAKREDDDERFYSNFIKRRGFALDNDYRSKWFLSADHKDFFDNLKKRGVMRHRFVDFSSLDDNGILVGEYFAALNLDHFCSVSEAVHPDLVAFFYSNLRFKNPDELFFSVHNRVYNLSAKDLAEILKVEYMPFKAIDLTPTAAYSFLLEVENFSRASSRHVSSTAFPLRFQIIHRIIINCLRPKAASVTDVSMYEAKITAAIVQGIQFSLPHMILLHMHRALKKTRGKLPYGSLITQIFSFFKIGLPTPFTKRKPIPSAAIDRQTLSKMLLKASMEGWRNDKGQLVPFGGIDDHVCLAVLRDKLEREEREKLNKKEKLKQKDKLKEKEKEKEKVKEKMKEKENEKVKQKVKQKQHLSSSTAAKGTRSSKRMASRAAGAAAFIEIEEDEEIGTEVMPPLKRKKTVCAIQPDSTAVESGGQAVADYRTADGEARQVIVTILQELHAAEAQEQQASQEGVVSASEQEKQGGDVVGLTETESQTRQESVSKGSQGELSEHDAEEDDIQPTIEPSTVVGEEEHEPDDAEVQVDSAQPPATEDAEEDDIQPTIEPSAVVGEEEHEPDDAEVQVDSAQPPATKAPLQKGKSVGAGQADDGGSSSEDQLATVVREVQGLKADFKELQSAVLSRIEGVESSLQQIMEMLSTLTCFSIIQTPNPFSTASVDQSHPKQPSTDP